jgi:hypothetical protein
LSGLSVGNPPTFVANCSNTIYLKSGASSLLLPLLHQPSKQFDRSDRPILRRLIHGVECTDKETPGAQPPARRAYRLAFENRQLSS